MSNLLSEQVFKIQLVISFVILVSIINPITPPLFLIALDKFSHA
jgi:hypothetical protein